MLLLTAFIWGSSFVAQSVGMERVQAFTFNGIRTLMGAATLLPFLLLRGARLRRRETPGQTAARKAEQRRMLLPGVGLGLILCLASNLQQQAFYYSTGGKIAFITAFYMIFVPVFGLVFGKRISWVIWLCVGMGLAGLYLLCVGDGGFSQINRGDLLTFACAAVFAAHILAIERFSHFEDSIRLSFTQFLVSGGVTAALALLFESPDPAAIRAAILPLLYSGVLSCGVAYTLQIVGQKYTESTVASLLMCSESVFGVVCSAIVLHERLTARETAGCAVMLAAILLSQLAPQKPDRAKQQKET